ncbi:quaternary amine ABC transporter ATP-binding protein [Ornithinimicrobium cavernae]|uniref:quaternary amine ABC transporter ATP-binding protein n=1 Tax=Ornithinimicrobium cavernae TaxID=2666047 RepID=UPI000D699973|nr:betaine/proline/choline family ABC transporter ATP-binding protein [Ornithinimicrobium cavernae]
MTYPSTSAPLTGSTTTATDPAPAPPLVVVEKVTKIYEGDRTGRRGRSRAKRPGTRAVDDLNFTVARGEVFVIMGLSGSGKSTMLRMLNRLVEPTSGSIRVGGQEITNVPESALRTLRNQTVTMVFQHFALFPHRTVLENAAYGLQVRGVDPDERRQRAAWALEKVGLGRWGSSRPSELSGGMRQRVGLARALATDADILLMDEPFSALDPLIRRDMQDLLLELQTDLQKTIVFVTHDLNEAMRLGHRIMVMRDGRAVQVGSADEILSTPADDYVAQFIADVDRSRVIRAGAAMHPADPVGHPDEAAGSLLTRVDEAGVDAAYAVGDDGRVAGVVTREDLLAAAGDGSPVRDLITQDYEAVDRHTVLIDLVQQVGSRPVPLAVLDADARLLGVLTRGALLDSLTGMRSHAS